MHSNKPATTVRSDVKHEETIWGIARWVVQNVDESRFSCANGELSRLTQEILVDNPSDVRLTKLFEAVGGNSDDHAAAMFRSMIYVSKAFCKYSSVYPKQWLDMYHKYVTELQLSGNGEFLEKDVRRITVTYYDKAVRV